MCIHAPKVPYYVVVLNDKERYRLDSTKTHMGTPSERLVAFAESRGLLLPNNVSAWDKFVRDTGIGVEDRKAMRCYLLIRGGETDDELRQLIDM